MRGQFSAAVRAILGAKKIVVSSHINPDGDALGSSLALCHALWALGKEATPLLADGVPEIYSWMPGVESVVRTTERRDFDLAIVCDAGTLVRVGTSIMPIIQAAPLVIDIDHHVADGPFGDIRILDDTVASTAELVWPLIQRLEKATGATLQSEAIARCLMCGVITDTGSFRFPSTRPGTFETAARLQRLGAAPAPITEAVFESRSEASIRLLGRALSSLGLSEDGRVGWAVVSAADFEEFGATDQDTEGVVNHVRAIRTVDIALLFREIPGKKVRISLRAREGADVNKVANVFGGGGHRLAAGCSVDLPLKQAVEVVSAEAIRQLNA
jgi:bifunctional oligoribonuclease and PAP phosphatase NrnA